MTSGPGALIGLLGAALVVLSGWLAWLSGPRTPRQSGYDIPARFLLDSHASAGGVNLGVVILVTGVLAAIGSVLAAGRFPALALGIVAIVVAGLFAYQLHLSVDDLNRTTHLGLQVRDVIGAGPLAAAAGGVMVVIGALLPGRKSRANGPGAAST